MGCVGEHHDGVCQFTGRRIGKVNGLGGRLKCPTLLAKHVVTFKLRDLAPIFIHDAVLKVR